MENCFAQRPPSLRYGAAGLLGEPKHREGFFGDHTGYCTLPSPRGIARDAGWDGAIGHIPQGEPYPVFHVTVITHRKDAVYPATIVRIPPMEDF